MNAGSEVFREVGLLGSSFLFAGLGGEELMELSSFVARKRVAAKTAIVRQGEPGSRMFAIVRGKVKVSVSSEDGREATLDILGDGEFFGEMTVLDGQARSASVIALETTDLVLLERSSLLAFLERTPRAAAMMLSALSQRLRATDALVEDTLFLNLPSRLAKKLLALAEEHGTPVPRGVRIEIKLSQQEIATLVGATRESVNRLLRLWEEQDAVLYEDGHVTIIDRPKLEAWQK